MPTDPGRLFDPEPPGGPVRRTRPAFDRTIRALRAGGRLEAADQLLVAVGRTNADRCDELRGAEGKEFHEAQALRLMFEIARELANIGGPASDAFDALLAAASGPAPVGD
jgi:hypothetical protein